MRSRYADVMPGAMKAMVALVREVRHSSLEPALVELVKIRASQMNGCAYCVDTHIRAARARHEGESRLQLLSVWRDAPCYSERERAALRWCEEVTLIAQTHAPDAAYDEIERWFSEEEMVALTFAIISINSFNRLSVAFRQPVDAPSRSGSRRRDDHHEVVTTLKAS
jgi:AhpD family alkylhydroperoxidase